VLDREALRLVAITDSLRDGIDGLASRAAAAVRGGATMIQLRLPDESPRVLVAAARALRQAAPDVRLVVNDRADVALAGGADGVHVGGDGLSVAALRRILPARFIIGVSVGDDDEIARAQGADYVAIGPVFASSSATTTTGMGLERFRALAAGCGVPVLAVGGLSPENAEAVIAAGAAGVAAISALLGAFDPMGAARAFRGSAASGT
jgi:thiamine-phosphate pyrophosphorylase